MLSTFLARVSSTGLVAWLQMASLQLCITGDVTAAEEHSTYFVTDRGLGASEKKKETTKTTILACSTLPPAMRFESKITQCVWYLWLALAVASPTSDDDLVQKAVSAGFVTPVKIDKSNGGNAVCLSGSVDVAASSNNTRLLYTGPASQLAATQTLIELLKKNSTLQEDTNGGSFIVNSTFHLYCKLCLPTDCSKLDTVQILTHGDAVDSGYWDLAHGYSYVDAAAEAGYATFSYDRIGVGKSDHPDPVQIVQAYLSVEILHKLVSIVNRTAPGPSRSFKNIIGVGHSAGSFVTQAVTAKYPEDFSAVILTGVSTAADGLSLALSSFDYTIANQDPAPQFQGIANGYLTAASAQGIQFSFYSYPHFDPRIFASEVANKQTTSIGELLTLGGIIGPAPNFDGPVDVVLGSDDFVECGGNCTSPVDLSATLVPAFYPKASNGSQHYIVPNAGHNINAHYSAPDAFRQMSTFLKNNNF